MLDQLIQEHVAAVQAKENRLRQIQAQQLAAFIPLIRAYLPADLWQELGVPIADTPMSLNPPMWSGDWLHGDVAIGIRVNGRSNYSQFDIWFQTPLVSVTDRSLTFDVSLPATRADHMKIAVALAEMHDAIVAARRRRRAELLERARARIESISDSSLKTTERIIDDAMDDLQLDDVAELEDVIAAAIARAQEYNDRQAAELDRQLAIAERAIHEAKAYLAEYETYRQACRAWAEAETARLWRPWYCWEVSFGAMAMNDEGEQRLSFTSEYVEPHVIPAPQETDATGDAGAPRIYLPKPPDPTGILMAIDEADGSQRSIMIHTAAYSVLRVFVEPSTSSHLPYHATIWRGGSCLNIPPGVSEPVFLDDLVEPLGWNDRLYLLVPEALEPSGYFAVSSDYRNGPLWRIFQWEPAEIAASTPDQLID